MDNLTFLAMFYLLFFGKPQNYSYVFDIRREYLKTNPKLLYYLKEQIHHI